MCCKPDLIIFLFLSGLGLNRHIIGRPGICWRKASIPYSGQGSRRSVDRLQGCAHVEDLWKPGDRFRSEQMAILTFNFLASIAHSRTWRNHIMSVVSARYDIPILEKDFLSYLFDAPFGDKGWPSTEPLLHSTVESEPYYTIDEIKDKVRHIGCGLQQLGSQGGQSHFTLWRSQYPFSSRSFGDHGRRWCVRGSATTVCWSHYPLSTNDGCGIHSLRP